MLVLTRKPSETLVISGGIEVTVLKVCGDRVSLGIVAHRSVGVDRKEVYEAKLRGEKVESGKVGK